MLLDKHPLAPGCSRPARVVIVGFGRLGRAVLREIARRPSPGGSPLSVRIHGASTEIELLAQMEHRRWLQERQAQGYVHGPDREGKQHPGLVDWQYLSETAQEKDRDTIRELPVILRQAGFQILRLPPLST